MNTVGFFPSIREFLAEHITGPGHDFIITIIMLAGIALCAVSGYYLTRLLLVAFESIIRKSPTTWDDDLLTSKFNKALSQLTPALVVSWMLPRCFATTEEGTVHWLNVLTSFYIIWAFVYIFNIFIDNLHNAMTRREKLRAYAVKGIFQMIKLIAICLGMIVAISLLIGKTPVAILTALGASAAVLMLVFKDTILGLVASVQLTANKMVHKGDWVVVPGHDTNGEVVDISLTTVKVLNWDNSITTIPPYSLVSESFRNYQFMKRADARRVNRSVYIDMNSIGFCPYETLEKLVTEKLADPAVLDCDTRHVNLSLFRTYLEQWIGNLPDVRTDLIFMVRQLEPTTSGLPVDIYFFTSLTDWKSYEHFQSEVFDHIYSVIPLFGLRIFQTPAGYDLGSSSLKTIRSIPS